MLYKNPIIPGFHPDPSICRVGEDFYLVTSTFEFFPGIPVYHSKNLINWELVSYCLTRDEQVNLSETGASCGLWAPVIRFHEGTFYVCVTFMDGNRTSGERKLKQLLFKTKDICGEWSVPIELESIPAIDPSIAFIDDKMYVTIAGIYNNIRAIYQWEADCETGKMLTNPRMLTMGSEGTYAEGPHLYKMKDKYYLLTAEGGTFYGHLESCFRSDSPYGPFELEPNAPMLTHRHVIMEQDLQSTGHADLVDDQHGNWWLVFLGTRGKNSSIHHLGRETNLTPIIWENGWPKIPGGKTVPLNIEAELPAKAVPQTRNYFETDFAFGVDSRFNFIRNPKRENYIKSENGFLLKGNGALSMETGAPTFIGVRQAQNDCELVCYLELKENSAGGITAYYNDSYFYNLKASISNDEVTLMVERNVHGFISISRSIILDSISELRICADKEWYYFEYLHEKEWKRLDAARVSGLSSEGMFEMTFTGVYLGAFCQSGEINIKSFSYKELEEKI